MRIEKYILASRRVKKTNAHLCEIYKKQFSVLCKKIDPNFKWPTLYTTYSALRMCELVTLDNEHYLVHDQNLGQTFNYLNRIQVASSDARQSLSKYYGSRYLAENLILCGSPELALLLAALSQGFKANSGSSGNPFDVIEEADEVRRINYTAVQECFILAHELGHYVCNAEDQSACRSFKDNSERGLESFLRREQTVWSKGELSVDGLGYYGEIYQETPDLKQELYADYIALVLTYDCMVTQHNLNPVDIGHGIILAFKYLRLLRYWSNLVVKLSEFRTPEHTYNSIWLHSIEQELCRGAKPTDRLSVSQFRENYLRMCIESIGKEHGHKGSIINPEVLDDYDMATEFPATFGILDTLKDSNAAAAFNGILENRKTKMEIFEIVDRLTLWRT